MAPALTTMQLTFFRALLGQLRANTLFVRRSSQLSEDRLLGRAAETLGVDSTQTRFVRVQTSVSALGFLPHLPVRGILCQDSATSARLILERDFPPTLGLYCTDLVLQTELAVVSLICGGTSDETLTQDYFSLRGLDLAYAGRPTAVPQPAQALALFQTPQITKDLAVNAPSGTGRYAIREESSLLLCIMGLIAGFELISGTRQIGPDADKPGVSLPIVSTLYTRFPALNSGPKYATWFYAELSKLQKHFDLPIQQVQFSSTDSTQKKIVACLWENHIRFIGDLMGLDYAQLRKIFAAGELEALQSWQQSWRHALNLEKDFQINFDFGMPLLGWTSPQSINPLPDRPPNIPPKVKKPHQPSLLDRRKK